MQGVRAARAKTPRPAAPPPAPPGSPRSRPGLASGRPACAAPPRRAISKVSSVSPSRTEPGSQSPATESTSSDPCTRRPSISFPAQAASHPGPAPPGATGSARASIRRAGASSRSTSSTSRAPSSGSAPVPSQALPRPRSAQCRSQVDLPLPVGPTRSTRAWPAASASSIRCTGGPLGPQRIERPARESTGQRRGLRVGVSGPHRMRESGRRIRRRPHGGEARGRGATSEMREGADRATLFGPVSSVERSSGAAETTECPGSPGRGDHDADRGRSPPAPTRAVLPPARCMPGRRRPAPALPPESHLARRPTAEAAPGIERRDRPGSGSAPPAPDRGPRRVPTPRSRHRDEPAAARPRNQPLDLPAHLRRAGGMPGLLVELAPPAPAALTARARSPSRSAACADCSSSRGFTPSRAEGTPAAGGSPPAPRSPPPPPARR